jgi:hypothetical protein
MGRNLLDILSFSLIRLVIHFAPLSIPLRFATRRVSLTYSRRRRHRIQ